MPRRRCVGCGAVQAKAELVRLALEASSGEAGGAPRVVLDDDGRLPGRGAYVCREGGGGPRKSCLELGLKRGGLARGLRRSSLTGTRELVESI